MAGDVLDDRTLNRTLLARQGLLRRERRPVADVVRHLVGLQAQEPRNPYVALWSRVEGFDPAELEDLLVGRQVVRTVTLRGTVHLHLAGDVPAIRPLCQPVLDRELATRKDVGPLLEGVDLAPVDDAARAWLAEAPRTTAELRALIGEAFPDLPAAAAAYALRNRLTLVQVPPRGLWSRSGQVRLTTFDCWVGAQGSAGRWWGQRSAPARAAPARAAARAAAAALDELVLRYLRAFGPATPGDVSTWCRLTGIREVVERLRPRLRTWRDARGRELFDVPDGLVADGHEPAPVRFLPEFDNVLLAHDDRTRIVRGRPWSGPAVVDRPGLGHVLVDGFHAGFWHVRDGRLVVEHTAPRLATRAASAVTAEGRRLLRFLGVDGDRDVVLRPLGG